MRKILVDTNLLLDDHRILKKLSVEYDKVVVPLTVLKELDRHKFNPDLSYSARNAIHAILDFRDRNPDKLILTQEDDEFSDNDSKILEAAIREEAAIATKDISMSLIADAKGIETRLYDVVVNHLFDPYIDITFKELFNECETFSYAAKFSDEDYAEMIALFGKVHGKKIRVDAWFFVFLRDADQFVIYANNPLTNELVRIDNVPTYREFNIDGTSIKAMDEYQVCAFYALIEAPNVVLTGKWGSGKTLLGTAYSLARAKRKSFITRPPIGINKKYDIGFVPGDKSEKMLDWFAGFLSALYFIYSNTRGQKGGRSVEYDHVKEVLFQEKFETVPLNAVQGMSLLEEDILIVDEIQLIDIDYLSMILSRGGVGSKVILLGDSGQSYGVVKPSESGLLKLLRLLPHPSLAYVNLRKSYRSSLLELADQLQDNILKL